MAGGQCSPPRIDSPRAGAAGAGAAPLRRGRGGGARGLKAARGVPAAAPSGRAGFLARRTGGPWTLLGQMLPKARRRPPCPMLPPRSRHQHRPRPQTRRAPSVPLGAAPRAGVQARARGAGAMPWAACPPSLHRGAETSRRLPRPRRQLPRPRSPSPRPPGRGGPTEGAAPEVNPRREAADPSAPAPAAAPPAPRSLGPPSASLPGGLWGSTCWLCWVL